jgi:hypothetical protein
MKTNLFLISSLLLILVLSSCKKEETKDYSSTSEFFNDNRQESQKFSFPIDEDYTYTSESGTEFTFYGWTFDREDGGLTSGEISVELREFYDKADMIFENVMTTTNNSLLESAGFFYIRTTNNGNIVHGKISIKIPTESINPEMELFFGRSDSLPVTWFPATDSLNYVVSDEHNYYLEFINDFDWINIDSFIDEPKSDFKVSVLKNPSQNNTRVYFLLDSLNSVAQFWEVDVNLFHCTFIPVGYSGKLFALSFFDSQAYYYLEPMTTTPVVVKEIELIPVTSSDLVEIMSNL